MPAPAWWVGGVGGVRHPTLAKSLAASLQVNQSCGWPGEVGCGAAPGRARQSGADAGSGPDNLRSIHSSCEAGASALHLSNRVSGRSTLPCRPRPAPADMSAVPYTAFAAAQPLRRTLLPPPPCCAPPLASQRRSFLSRGGELGARYTFIISPHHACCRAAA